MRNPITVAREKAQSAKETVTEVYHANKGYYDFCAGSIATSATIYFAVNYARSKGYGRLYDPSQPIPGLRLDEESLKRDVAAGILAVDFFKQRGLTQDYIGYCEKRVKELMDSGVEDVEMTLIGGLAKLQP